MNSYFVRMLSEPNYQVVCLLRRSCHQINSSRREKKKNKSNIFNRIMHFERYRSTNSIQLTYSFNSKMINHKCFFLLLSYIIESVIRRRMMTVINLFEITDFGMIKWERKAYEANFHSNSLKINQSLIYFSRIYFLLIQDKALYIACVIRMAEKRSIYYLNLLAYNYSNVTYKMFCSIKNIMGICQD
jgi:hypothetical protein